MSNLVRFFTTHPHKGHKQQQSCLFGRVVIGQEYGSPACFLQIHCVHIY